MALNLPAQLFKTRADFFLLATGLFILSYGSLKAIVVRFLVVRLRIEADGFLS